MVTVGAGCTVIWLNKQSYSLFVCSRVQVLVGEVQREATHQLNSALYNDKPGYNLR
jgi:hypothetical protein